MYIHVTMSPYSVIGLRVDFHEGNVLDFVKSQYTYYSILHVQYIQKATKMNEPSMIYI